MVGTRPTWDFVAEQSGENAMGWVVINPGGVFGSPPQSKRRAEVISMGVRALNC